MVSFRPFVLRIPDLTKPKSPEVRIAYLDDHSLPTDKFSSWSKSSSNLKATSLIIITMDLTPEQVDQIVALEFRKLERDYQQTIAADGKLDQALRIEGTPNLDALIADVMAEKKNENTFGGAGRVMEGEDDEGSWGTEEDEEEQENGGFQKLQNEESDEENADISDDKDQPQKTDGGTSPQQRINLEETQDKLKSHQSIIEEVKLQPKGEVKIDHKSVQEVMSSINFPAPAWAKKYDLLILVSTIKTGRSSSRRS